tara:strand:- start:6625 stop:6732 length:108 start_codon:yes stop_codon:yes gene_type:complete
MNRMLEIYFSIEGIKINNKNAPNQVHFFCGDINKI